LIKIFAGPLIAALLCLQVLNLAHEISDSFHKSGQQCEFCLKFERTGLALNSSIGQPALVCLSPRPLRPGSVRTVQLSQLLSPEPRGPPINRSLPAIA
jgi:hypothetical protein